MGVTGDAQCIVRMQDYHSLCRIRIQFHFPKVTPLTNPAEVVDHYSTTATRNARRWHNSVQSGVIGIADQPIF